MAGCQAIQTTSLKGAASLRACCGYLTSTADTCISTKKYELCYENGILKTAREKHRTWTRQYLFSDSLKLRYAIKRSGSKQDTIIKPWVLSNKR